MLAIILQSNKDRQLQECDGKCHQEDLEQDGLFEPLCKADVGKSKTYKKRAAGGIEHVGVSVTYPVPGTVHQTTIRTCNRCKEEEREGYGYGDDLKEFSWTVVEGTEYLTSGVHKKEYRGSLVEISVTPPTDSKLKMTIRGTDIPAVKEIDGQQVFAFIMPYGDINITIEKVEETHASPAE